VRQGSVALASGTFSLSLLIFRDVGLAPSIEEAWRTLSNVVIVRNARIGSGLVDSEPVMFRFDLEFVTNQCDNYQALEKKI
jgi:hypothetical protein